MLCIYLKGLYNQSNIRQEVRTCTRMFGGDKLTSNYMFIIGKKKNLSVSLTKQLRTLNLKSRGQDLKIKPIPLFQVLKPLYHIFDLEPRRQTIFQFNILPHSFC